MKLPNGFGTVYKMQGNRRRPYVAKKTIQGKQKPLGYFETFEEAMAYLVEYNHNPTLLSPSKTTFAEIYAFWKNRHFPQLSEAARISYKNSYRHCSRLHSMIFVDIRLGHLDQVIDDVRHAGCGYPTQKKVRSLLEQLYKYALRYDLVVKDYARYLDIDRPRQLHKKKPFTVRQRNRLWRGIDEMPEVRHVLMLIFTGCRVGEYRHIRKTDVNRTVIKLILGHSLEGVTERVYTHKSVRELLRAIDKVCT